MRWPWQRSERRESQPFTDAVVEAIRAQAAGASTSADASATAALEAASGLVARAFASADVRDAGRAGRALGPHTLALIGRNLIRRGESLFLIEVADELRLIPAGSWDVRGDWRESSWWYRLDMFGPSGNVTRLVPSAGAVHCRYAYDPARPWHGLAPLAWARLTGRLLGETETALADEASGPRGSLVPVPNTPGDEGDDDDDEKRARDAPGRHCGTPGPARPCGDDKRGMGRGARGGSGSRQFRLATEPHRRASAGESCIAPQRSRAGRSVGVRRSG